jgi:hypothetical protein
VCAHPVWLHWDELQCWAGIPQRGPLSVSWLLTWLPQAPKCCYATRRLKPNGRTDRNRGRLYVVTAIWDPHYVAGKITTSFWKNVLFNNHLVRSLSHKTQIRITYSSKYQHRTNYRPGYCSKGYRLTSFLLGPIDPRLPWAAGGFMSTYMGHPSLEDWLALYEQVHSPSALPPGECPL